MRLLATTLLLASAASAHDTPDIVAGKADIALAYWQQLDAAGQQRMRSPANVFRIMYPDADIRGCHTKACDAVRGQS